MEDLDFDIRVMRPASVARWELARSAAGDRERSAAISAVVKKLSKNLRKFFVDNKAAPKVITRRS